MNSKLTCRVASQDVGRPICKYLTRKFTIPHSLVYRALRQNKVKINGQHCHDKNYPLQLDDEITIFHLKLENSAPKRDNAEQATSAFPNLNIIYEDAMILVVNKPAKLVMHGSSNSLNAQVASYLKTKADDTFCPSSIGRLDKGTSGLVVYGKNYEVVKLLNAKADEFEKIYQFISDLPASTNSNIRIGHDENNAREKVYSHGHKEAITEFMVMGPREKYAKLITGRKHQIRVTLAHLGYPIHGDTKYGAKPAARLFLHCYKIKLPNLAQTKFSSLSYKEFSNKPDWN